MESKDAKEPTILEGLAEKYGKIKEALAEALSNALEEKGQTLKAMDKVSEKLAPSRLAFFRLAWQVAKGEGYTSKKDSGPLNDSNKHIGFATLLLAIAGRQDKTNLGTLSGLMQVARCSATRPPETIQKIETVIQAVRRDQLAKVIRAGGVVKDATGKETYLIGEKADKSLMSLLPAKRTSPSTAKATPNAFESFKSIQACANGITVTATDPKTLKALVDLALETVRVVSEAHAKVFELAKAKGAMPDVTTIAAEVVSKPKAKPQSDEAAIKAAIEQGVRKGSNGTEPTATNPAGIDFQAVAKANRKRQKEATA